METKIDIQSAGQAAVLRSVEVLAVRGFRAKETAIAALLAERERQDKKWGEQNHDPITWSAILSEECGEFAEAALHAKFGGHAAGGLRDEAIHCAAVALQIVECLDRNSSANPEMTERRHP